MSETSFPLVVVISTPPVRNKTRVARTDPFGKKSGSGSFGFGVFMLPFGFFLSARENFFSVFFLFFFFLFNFLFLFLLIKFLLLNIVRVLFVGTRRLPAKRFFKKPDPVRRRRAVVALVFGTLSPLFRGGGTPGMAIRRLDSADRSAPDSDR
jgi:hypothetical protein